MAAAPPSTSLRPHVKRALIPALVVRWIGNTVIRFPFSFLPTLARGSGLSIDQLSLVLSVRDLTGLAAPAAGRAADRFGPGRVMVAFSWLATVATLASALGQLGLAIGFVVFGFAKIGFDVALNGWVGDEVAYERRARVSGIVELTWALAALIGIPVVGLLIDGFTWWLPALVLGGVSVPATLALQSAFRDRSHRSGSTAVAAFSLEPLRRPAVFGAILAIGGLNIGAQILVVAHGRWLEDTYNFDPAAIGFAVITIGLVEFVASSSSSGLADRLGKRRSVTAGGLVLAAAMTVMALVPEPPLALGLALLSLAFLGYEFGFVSSLPLIAELDPAARSTIIGFVLGGATFFRAVGSPLGTWLYNTGAWSRAMTGATLGTLVGIVILLAMVKEPEPRGPEHLSAGRS